MRRLCLITLFLFGCSSSPKKAVVEQESCTATREFITTFEYLKANTYGLEATQRRTIADQVSKGCTFAAKRFIQTLELLVSAEVAPKDAIPIASQMALSDDMRTQTFLLVFSESFREDRFNLNLQKSLQLGVSLSTDFTGEIDLVKKDFSQLAKFCHQESRLGLPPTTCGLFIGRLIQESKHQGIAGQFIEFYHFLRSYPNLKLPIPKALDLAKKITTTNWKATENFMQAFRYAMNPNGLALSAVDSLNFSERMTQRTSAP